MNLIIFGATGAVGRHLIDQALSQGHRVTAFTRNPSTLDQADGLRVVEGDVFDQEGVETATAGHDAAFCALGMPLLNKDMARTHGTKNIVAAMEATDVRRLICLSALGAGESRDILPFRYKAFLVPLLMRHLYADHNGQESLVKKSALDWVIVRPSNFSKGARTGTYRHGFDTLDPSLSLKISPADVADFMLSHLTDDTYLHRSPALSN